MKSVDGDGPEEFVGETGPMFQDLMGIALFKTKTGEIQAIVGRKSSPPDGRYL